MTWLFPSNFIPSFSFLFSTFLSFSSNFCSLKYYSKNKPKYLDLDQDIDTAISEVLAGCLDQAQKVEKIQLEIGPSSSSTSIMVSERKCQGTDTIHMSKSTLRRDYTDI